MITYKLKINLQSEREMYSDMVFTTGDKNGYVLEFSFYDNGTAMNLSGCGLTVKSKRADGAVVIDGGTIAGNLAKYTVADNACEVAGELAMEVTLVRTDGSCATTKVIYARVREGFGEEGLSSADNEPILARLEARAISLQGAMNALETSFSVHKSDPSAHEEAFAEERKRFNPLYCNALKGAQEGESLTITDAVEGTPLSLSLYGKCIETLANPDEEKSPDNPATITGIGESGSVTVTVTEADGTEKEMAVPLSKPLYDLTKTSSESTPRDKITSEGIYIQTNRIALDTLVFYVLGESYADGCTQFCSARLDGAANNLDETIAMRHASVFFVTHFGGYIFSGNPNKNTDNMWAEITYGGNGRFRLFVRNSFLNLTDTDTDTEKVEKLMNWFASQREAGTPVEMIYGLNTPRFESNEIIPKITAQNGMTITTGEGAEMKAEYNRDINKAFEELAAAVVASV